MSATLITWTLIVMACGADEFRDFTVKDIQTKEACAQAAEHIRKGWAFSVTSCVPIVVIVKEAK